MSMSPDQSGIALPDSPSPALDEWFDKRFDDRLAQQQANKTPKLSILASKGTLDWAYPAFIIGSTAGAMGWEVNLFFTFYGLGLLKKDLDLQISPIGNPAMPMKMPFGPGWFQGINWNMPNIVMSNIPGFESMATTFMKMTMKNKGVAPIADLREACVEVGVKLVACNMTADLFGWDKDEFIPEIHEWAGAATYLTEAQDADVTLYM